MKLGWIGWLGILGAGLLLLTRMRPAWAIPGKGLKYADVFHFVEANYELPANLLARMAQQESNYNPAAISPAGAVGIMQIIPRYHPDVDATNPAQAIHYAGKYMDELHTQFGNWRDALGAYNWGPGNVKNAIEEHGRNWLAFAPLETQNYVKDIANDIRV